jgi:hypothetical protein
MVSAFLILFSIVGFIGLLIDGLMTGSVWSFLLLLVIPLIMYVLREQLKSALRRKRSIGPLVIYENGFQPPSPVPLEESRFGQKYPMCIDFHWYEYIDNIAVYAGRENGLVMGLLCNHATSGDEADKIAENPAYKGVLEADLDNLPERGSIIIHFRYPELQVHQGAYTNPLKFLEESYEISSFKLGGSLADLLRAAQKYYHRNAAA